MNNVCFIVVSYNSEKYIARCIESIMLYEPLSGVIVVDNNSCDSTVNILERYENIDVIVSNVNLGFGKANNLGIEMAIGRNYEYVFLLNDDAFLLESVVLGLVGLFKLDVRLGILSPIQMDIMGSKLEQKFENFMFEQGKLSEIKACLDMKFNKTELLQVNFCQAAAWMMPTRLLKNIGLFNPLFFHYGEDNELVNRLSFVNYKVGIALNFKVSHQGNPKAIEYEKNFSSYHRNRKLSKWLNNSLNLKNDFGIKFLLQECKTVIKLALRHFLKFDFKKIIGIIFYLVTLLSLYSPILQHRKDMRKRLSNIN
jgi:GT2 family glycosyltransferase